MGQSSDKLRNKFGFGTSVIDAEKDVPIASDGIEMAEKAIIDAGGKIEKGCITYEGDNQDAIDAVHFLCEEWDYCIPSKAHYSQNNG